MGKSEQHLSFGTMAGQIPNGLLTNANKPSSWFDALLTLKRNAIDPASLVTIN
jgi:hypothetical protein